MTREEAIRELRIQFVGEYDRQREAKDMAVEALQQQQPNEDEKVIRIKKGTLKVRTGRYVIYDVEWLKTHFNTTEAKIYGQPNEDCISRKGYWIEHKYGGIEHIECSECRCWFLRKDLIRNSYCPNCGSRNHWEWELKMQEVKK